MSDFSSEDEVRQALGAYFEGLHNCDVARFSQVWHPEGHLYGVGPDGALVDRDAAAFYDGLAVRGKSSELAKHDRVLGIQLLDSRTASAKVQIALPPAPGSPTPSHVNTLYTDFLVLLKDDKLGWRIISKVFDPAALDSAEPPVSGDPNAPAEAAWGYIKAGRACSGADMAQVFHPNARLTFATEQGSVEVHSCADFCERVEKRWSMDLHKPYAHLCNDPVIEQEDRVLGVDFAGPNCALVTLRIGYPPCLYTDFLSMVKLAKVEGLDRAGWWIVAKSSANTPFLAEKAEPDASNGAS